MTDPQRCPSCGLDNEPGAAACAHCNFPLREGAATPSAAGPAGKPASAASAPDDLPAIDIRRIRPIRPRRPGGREQVLQTQLMVGLGGLAVVITILWVAWQGFHKNNPAEQQVEGANAEQEQAALLARGEIQRDSTNVNAQIALANVLYDTANWSEAIIHYRSALRLDPTRVTTVVDLGVCYYNLSDTPVAESLFTQALAMDPRQPVALFNLGIVNESRNEFAKALDFFHRAQVSGPPPGMDQALQAAIQRINTRQAGTSPGPGGMPPGGGNR